MLTAGANFLLKRRATRLSCHKGCSICCAVGSWRVRDRNGAARDEWNDQKTKRSDRGTRSNLDAFDVLGSFKNPQIIVVDTSYIQVFLHTMSWRWTSIWNCLQLCVCWSFASWYMLKGTHWPVISPMKSWNLFVIYIPTFLLIKSMFLSRAAEVSQHSHQRSPAAQIRSLPQTCHPKGHQNRTWTEIFKHRNFWVGKWRKSSLHKLRYIYHRSTIDLP